MVIFEDACLVEIAPGKSWLKQQPSPDNVNTYSTSGIFFNAKNGYVFTHGSILISHLSKNKILLKQFGVKGHFPANAFRELHARVRLKIVDPKKEQRSYFTSIFSKNGLLPDEMKKYTCNMLEASSRCKVENNYVECLGVIKTVWKANKFAQTIKEFLPSSDEWSFHENPERIAASDDTLDSNLVAQLLPYFVLIELDLITTLNTNRNHVKRSLFNSNLTLGDPVYVVGTPFGAMNPAIFFNSLSKGIVCNLAGANQELIITDARCIPGSEGAPVYVGSGQTGKCLVGLVASALCWKANEWIGLSLVCHIGEVLHSLSDVTNVPELSTSFDLNNNRNGFVPEESCARINPSIVPVVLVKKGSTWGSGVIVDQAQGIILTCGHVAYGQSYVKVRVTQPYVQWYTAEVIHATPMNDVFDVGVLRMLGYKTCSDWPNRIVVAQQVHEGDTSYVIGHANFGHQYNLQASVTCGIISKVNCSQGIPMLIQSTCTVNAGASGGPLVAKNGSIYGIVTCNARDTGTGASYPHINLSLPLTTVWPFIENYLITNDSSILQHMHVQDNVLSELWSMKAAISPPVITSKL